MGPDCRAIEDLLYEVEEILTEAELTNLNSHLERCEQCRAERELFLESWNALQELDQEAEPTPMVRAKVWQQIQKEQDSKSTPVAPKTDWGQYWKRLAVAGVALVLGFGMGRGLAPEHPKMDTSATSVAAQAEERSDFIDPDLIKLASQEGYSVEIFPESTDFSPIDQEMMSELAPTEEDRRWVQKSQGAVVPVQYISQEGGPPR